MARIKGSLLRRQRSALQRLESAYEKFKAGGEDKESWTSTRKSGQRVICHKGRSYNEECERMKKEINILKNKISKSF